MTTKFAQNGRGSAVRKTTPAVAMPRTTIAYVNQGRMAFEITREGLNRTQGGTGTKWECSAPKCQGRWCFHIQLVIAAKADFATPSLEVALTRAGRKFFSTPMARKAA